MNDPDITLSTGRVVRHTPMPNGATDASIVGEHPEMTPAEWEEYTHVMPLHREIDRLKQHIASNLQRMASARSLLAPLGNQPIPNILAIREALNILR